MGRKYRIPSGYCRKRRTAWMIPMMDRIKVIGREAMIMAKALMSDSNHFREMKTRIPVIRNTAMRT